jgi:hypothetical protein
MIGDGRPDCPTEPFTSLSWELPNHPGIQVIKRQISGSVDIYAQISDCSLPAVHFVQVINITVLLVQNDYPSS